jgi:hypothetical protein
MTARVDVYRECGAMWNLQHHFALRAVSREGHDESGDGAHRKMRRDAETLGR